MPAAPTAGSVSVGQPTASGVAGASAAPPTVGGSAAPIATAGTGAIMMPGAAGSGASPMNAGAAGQPNMQPAVNLDADIEKCYELRAHGEPTAGDKSKFTVPTGESYSSFIFQVPWTTPVQGLRFRHLADNKAVVHHWLLYIETVPLPDGYVEVCGLEGPAGLLCGQASTRTLLTGWAPGRGDFQLPADVGLELPPPGSLLAVEMHYFNSQATEATDQSGVEVCVTSKFRKNTASITWLGTQDLDIAPGTMASAAGTCRPLRAGMAAGEPIHILYSWPHMHKMGKHMKSVINRTGGAQEVLYDGEFNFERQVVHDSPRLLQPGDTITTTCTFQNTSTRHILFGASTEEEMCYNFVYAWPAHALDNPGGAPLGASNTCLH